MGRIIAGLLALAAASAGCRAHAPVELRAGDAGQGPVASAGASVGGRDSGGAGDGAEVDGGDGGDGSSARPEPPDAGSRPRPPTIVCAASPAPDRCQMHGDSSKGVRLVGTLITPRAVLERGVLDIDSEGNVGCAACDCGSAGDRLVIDCPDQVISPGFINLHDHLGYAGTPPLAHPGELYTHRSDWRLGENGHQALPFEGSATNAEIVAQELRMVLGGATSIVGAGGKRGLLRNLDVAALSEGLWPGVVRAETFPLDDSRSATDPASCVFGVRPDTREGARGARAYLPHVGEGTNARARDELRCALGELDLLGKNSAIVHAMALTRSDAERLARRGASVVWSPRSNLDLYGATAPVALLAGLGVRVALGTDWLASGSMNLLRELACAEQYDAQALGGYFDAYELWRMVTENAAWALGLERRFGALAVGLVGDVTVFRRIEEDVFASVIHARPAEVELVLRQGQPLAGSAALIDAFEAGEACERLDVCGSAKRVCVLETGLALASIRASGEAVYPLFNCDEPPGEPRCKAQVAQECPVDELECDRPPAPPAWDTSDADHDGVPDAVDTCPRASDAKQSDADGDGLGDACDPCPVANPGLMPCPRRIDQLRDPSARSPAGVGVTLTGVRMTALRTDGSKGFFVEDGDGAPYSGIFVYTETSPPMLALGEALVLRGYFESFQGTDQLVHPQIVERRVVGEYPALAIALTQALSDPARWTSMLVRLDGVEVTATNADAPRDYDETALSGGMRLDDALFPELDNTFAVGDSFSSIRGIFGFSFGNYKLWPRTQADLVVP